MKRAFVTGGSGFVGSAIVRALIEDGVAVRALVREASPRGNLEGLPVEIVTADLAQASEDDLARLVEGCDEVHHSAALYAFWAKDETEFDRVNLDGTRSLVRAATRAGVSRFVYTSSVATVAPILDTAATEASVARLEDAAGPYKRSKILAEAEVLRLVREEQAPVVIVNPSAPVGARDIRPTPTGRMIVDFLSGRMPAFVDTGLNIVDVDEVGQGHVLAARRGKIGERYILGGENLSLHEILLLLADIAGVKPPRMQIPHWVAMLVAHGSEGWARLSGSEPRVPLEPVRLARKAMYFDATRATRELGFVASPARAGLEKAVHWFVRNGRVKPGRILVKRL
jgi:dihydroflavonol-4-reductase